MEFYRQGSRWHESAGGAPQMRLPCSGEQEDTSRGPCSAISKFMRFVPSFFVKALIAMLAVAAPMSAQQDPFRWMDFHSPADRDIVVWVQQSLGAEKWTAIREIGVQYDAALVVTTLRPSPQSQPSDDTFTVWSLSLTSHNLTPLLQGRQSAAARLAAAGRRRAAGVGRSLRGLQPVRGGDLLHRLPLRLQAAYVDGALDARQPDRAHLELESGPGRGRSRRSTRCSTSPTGGN